MTEPMTKNPAARFAALILAVGGTGYYLGYDADAQATGTSAETALIYETPKATIEYWFADGRMYSLVLIPRPVLKQEQMEGETLQQTRSRLMARAKDELDSYLGRKAH